MQDNSRRNNREEVFADLVDHPGWKLFLEKVEKQCAMLRRQVFSATYQNAEADSMTAARAAAAIGALRDTVLWAYTEAGFSGGIEIERMFW